ncbi:hypothetical protein AXG93_3105s1350 [Marchantia polymorpha subsp. ruderalis]|uniref:Uncharacterized protein n=1 Tax=Marchantia polymorpha subsp. ruderalis TaxID=1480154 RepID=A0A176WJA5_MARPO|nr:hypothetical protein AXG93_3105s1350 [Marchantia polymorpha subsp. ruderalis]
MQVSGSINQRRRKKKVEAHGPQLTPVSFSTASTEMKFLQNQSCISEMFILSLSKKKPPIRTKHPGFIVQQVYDTVEKKLWELTDKDCEDSKKREIDLLVQKTRDALGELPNIDVEEAAQFIDQEEAEKTRRHSRRRTVPHLSINKDDSGEIVAKSSPVEITTKADAPPSAKIDTPSSCKTPNAGFPSDIAELLHANNVLTGQTVRDRWLEKITSTLKSVFDASEQSDTPMKVPETDNSTPKVDTPLDTNDVKTSEPTNGEGEQKLKRIWNVSVLEKFFSSILEYTMLLNGESDAIT